MKIAGKHNAANALAAWPWARPRVCPWRNARGSGAFPGLTHRSSWVADIAGVHYVDDSKGTNVGATIAAVAGMAGPLVMIAGGEGKGQDFSPLAAAFRGKVRAAVLIGKDAPAVRRRACKACAPPRRAAHGGGGSQAQRTALPGDTVLLSPACASLDMFRDYGHRGDVFAAAVRVELQGPPSMSGGRP